MKPTPNEAEQAATLLGIDVFYLGTALRVESEARFHYESRKVGQYERPNFGIARGLLWAAEAADEAWRMVREAEEEEVPA